MERDTCLCNEYEDALPPETNCCDCEYDPHLRSTEWRFSLVKKKQQTHNITKQEIYALYKEKSIRKLEKKQKIMLTNMYTQIKEILLMRDFDPQNEELKYFFDYIYNTSKTLSQDVKNDMSSAITDTFCSVNDTSNAAELLYLVRDVFNTSELKYIGVKFNSFRNKNIRDKMEKLQKQIYDFQKKYKEIFDHKLETLIKTFTVIAYSVIDGDNEDIETYVSYFIEIRNNAFDFKNGYLGFDQMVMASYIAVCFHDRYSMHHKDLKIRCMPELLIKLCMKLLDTTSLEDFRLFLREYSIKQEDIYYVPNEFGTPAVTQERFNESMEKQEKLNAEAAERTLLRKIYLFCVLSSESLEKLERDWNEIKTLYEQKNWSDTEKSIGSRFIERYGETLTERGLNVALTAKNIDAFVSAPNFCKAVENIRLQDIVITDLRDKMSTRDTDLRQAFRSIAQTTASTLQAELDKALGKLREEQEVLPRLLEELQRLKA